jgi:hypothetical protein
LRSSRDGGGVVARRRSTSPRTTRSRPLTRTLPSAQSPPLPTRDQPILPTPTCCPRCPFCSASMVLPPLAKRRQIRALVQGEDEAEAVAVVSADTRHDTAAAASRHDRIDSATTTTMTAPAPKVRFRPRVATARVPVWAAIHSRNASRHNATRTATSNHRMLSPSPSVSFVSARLPAVADEKRRSGDDAGFGSGHDAAECRSLVGLGVVVFLIHLRGRWCLLALGGFVIVVALRARRTDSSCALCRRRRRFNMASDAHRLAATGTSLHFTPPTCAGLGLAWLGLAGHGRPRLVSEWHDL